MCYADARDHSRVAKNDWRAGEVVEESNSGTKKNRHDVDVNFVEEASIQALLDSVGAVDPNGLPAGGEFCLVHGTFDVLKAPSILAAIGSIGKVFFAILAGTEFSPKPCRN